MEREKFYAHTEEKIKMVFNKSVSDHNVGDLCQWRIDQYAVSQCDISLFSRVFE